MTSTDLVVDPIQTLFYLSDLSTYVVEDEAFYGGLRSTIDFKVLGEVGDGSSSSVFAAKDKNEIVVLKYLNKTSVKHLTKEIFREITILKSLKHDNIIKLLGVALAPDLGNICLVLEHCTSSLGKLIDYPFEGYFKIPQIKCIAKQLFRGLDFLHKNHIMHRDLTPSNCLINHEGKLKISDFGLCRREPSRESLSNTLTPEVITRWYRAPEILLQAPSYGLEVDLWSAGCILGEVLLRKPLLKGESDIQQISFIIDLIGTPSSNVWPGYSQCKIPKTIRLKSQSFNRIAERFIDFSGLGVMDIISSLLVYNPEDRASAGACREHEWIEKSPVADSRILIPGENHNSNSKNSK